MHPLSLRNKTQNDDTIETTTIAVLAIKKIPAFWRQCFPNMSDCFSTKSKFPFRFSSAMIVIFFSDFDDKGF